MEYPRPNKVWAAGAVLCSLWASTLTAAVDSQTDTAAQILSLQEQVAQLRAANAELQVLKQQMSQIKAESNGTWLNERRAEEVKGLVREVLSDAQTRASLQESGMTAGHNGKNFFLGSEDGNFLMEISGQIQMRYIANFRDNTSDDNEMGFEIRRAKLAFEGHIAEPKLTYAIQLAVDRNNNSAGADKIVIGYKLMDGVKVWAGEDKAPFLREEMISSKRQLAVERSVFNEEFTLDKVQGVGLDIDAGEMVKLYAMINDGTLSGDAATKPAPFTQTTPPNGSEEDRSTGKRFDNDDVDVAFTGRVEVKLAGDWKQMKDFTSWSGEEFAAFLGAAVHYEVGETGDLFLNNNFVTWTIDGSVEVNGFNIFGALAGHHTDLEMESVASPDRELFGFLIQGGYNFAAGEGSLEPFARYEFIDFDGAYGTTGTGRDEELNLVTVGANYYFKKHDAKFTLDVVFALDNVANSHSGLGILEDTADEHGQVVVRSQFQLLF